MTRRRISFFVHDLASNPIVRAAALAGALARDHEVEIIGFLQNGEQVYEPYRHLFPYKTITVSRDTAAVLASIPKLAALATGDVIYACKPLMTSFAPALYAARVLARRPLLLDVEDDEWATPRSTWGPFLWRDVIKGWRHSTAWKFTRALHLAVPCADGISVSTRRLQQRYGGEIVRHGPADAAFDPGRSDLADRSACRRTWNLPADVPLALFAGTPQVHKGWSTLLAALAHPAAASWHLVLAGPPDHPDFQTAASALGSRCHRIGSIPHTRMPELLAAVDAVPVPQLDVPFAQSQLPAKLIDAMAMARPVLATRVGDLPEILGDGTRGWLIEPGDAAALALSLERIARQPDEARDRARAARAWYLAEASPDVVASRILALIERTRARSSRAVAAV